MTRLTCGTLLFFCHVAGNASAASLDGLARGLPNVQTVAAFNEFGIAGVTALTFDHEGKLWVGTQEGAGIYNGQRVEPVQLPVKGAHFVQAILAAADGSMWLSTCDAGVFRLAHGTWTQFDHKTHLPDDEVHSLYQSADNAIWIGTTHGIVRVVGDAWQTFSRAEGVPEGQIHALRATAGRHGDIVIWAGTDNGLLRFSDGTWHLLTEKDGLVDRRVWSLLPSDFPVANTLWVGTENGLSAIEPDAIHNFQQKDGLPANYVYALAELPAGSESRLCVGTYDGGVGLFDGHNWETLDAKSGLPNNVIFSLIVNPPALGPATLWVGHTTGISRMSGIGWRHFSRDSALSAPDSTEFLQRTVGAHREMWLARAKSLTRLSDEGRKEYRLPSPSPTVVSLAASTLGEDPPLFAGTMHGDLFTFADHAWKPTPLPNGGSDNTIWGLRETVAKSGERTLWVARRFGLARRTDDKWRIDDTHTGLPHEWATAVAETSDSQGARQIWVGTFGGGLARELPHGWQAFSGPESVDSAFVTTLLADSKKTGRLWIGTGGNGVVRLDQDASGLHWHHDSVTTDPAMLNGFVYQFQQDAAGALYATTNRGVARITPGEDGAADSIVNFTSENGLPSDSCMQGVSSLDDGGRIWVGTAAGFSVFDPTREHADHTAKPLLIEKTELDGHLPFAADANLTYKQNNVSFEYALLSYFEEKETRYRTQLVGLDATPTAWVSDAKRNFTTLPSGPYTFQVWGKDAAGNVSGPALQRFVIHPPLWVRWWAMLGYGLVVACAVAGGVRVRLRQLQSRQKELEEEVKKRTEEVERKNQELSQANVVLETKNDELQESYKNADRIFKALADALEGTTLDGKYRLDAKIGEGGFGAVFRATVVESGAEVAVKVFRPVAGNDSASSLERFRQEAKTAGLVLHKNAVAILDSGVSSDGFAYLTMELLNGVSLKQELEAHSRLPSQRAIDISVQVLRALAQAHAVGIIHRDIKPDNIVLHHAAGEEIVKVIDFGVAKQQNRNLSMQTVTMTGAVVGTPTYMAPERLEDKDYDGRSDVYSVGIMLYEMLAGRPPFKSDGANVFSLVMAHMTKAPQPLTDFDINVPEALQAAVTRALDKDATARPTAAELAELLLEKQS